MNNFSNNQKSVGSIMSTKKSALRSITGLSPEEIAGLKVESEMSLTGEETPHRKSIVVEKDRFLQGANTEQAFEIIVEKIAKVTDARREEVENALIVTGSPIAVRGWNRAKLNAEIQNRLVDVSPQGMAFRQMMTALVGALYGKALVNDGFFRTKTPTRELKAMSVGGGSTPEEMLGNPFANTGYTSGIPNTTLTPSTSTPPITNTGSGSNILPYQKNSSGGVDQTKTETDWGGILSGSAQVITSIGGVIGLFTGGNQTQEGASQFDYYSEDDEIKGNDKKGWKWLIVGLFIVGIVVAMYFMFRKKK